MLTRRRFLQTTTGLLIGAGLPPWPGGANAAGSDGPLSSDALPITFSERMLWLHRVQTKEEGRVLYYRENSIIPDGYSLLCYLLRDVRANKVTRIDVKLIHLLFGMQAWMRSVGIRQPLRVNSGYCTPKTHADTDDRAAHSQHLSGKAADFAVEGLPGELLVKLALKFGAGGVGLYPAFIHVDTGPVRVWTG